MCSKSSRLAFLVCGQMSFWGDVGVMEVTIHKLYSRSVCVGWCRASS